MKKSREDARNATRWLESEFSKGSRFLRMQRSYETLAIPMLKAPRKFGIHLHIAKILLHTHFNIQRNSRTSKVKNIKKYKEIKKLITDKKITRRCLPI